MQMKCKIMQMSTSAACFGSGPDQSPQADPSQTTPEPTLSAAVRKRLDGRLCPVLDARKKGDWTSPLLESGWAWGAESRERGAGSREPGAPPAGRGISKMASQGLSNSCLPTLSFRLQPESLSRPLGNLLNSEFQESTFSPLRLHSSQAVLS